MKGTEMIGGITIMGLGPAEASLLTREAWEWLGSIQEIYLRTRQHPAVEGLPSDLVIQSFDACYERNNSFESTYQEIINQVLLLGRRPQGVTYAVPGHPFVAEATCPEIIRLAQADGIPVRVIEGLSFLEPMFSLLHVDPFNNIVLLDALDCARKHYINFPPNLPVIFCQIHSRLVASELKLMLMSVYPDLHPVKLVHAAGTKSGFVEDLHLYEIDRSNFTGLLTALYLPPLGDGTSMEEFQEVIARLRAPDGCPWDKKQTHLSLRPYLLEETYETLAALDLEDREKMKEELGDLLLQIVLHAQIASEEGEFNMQDVLKSVNQKIVRRHPHVFRDVAVSGEEGVLVNWEKIKAEERRENENGEGKGLLNGIPPALPALSQAQQIQERAARVGFDWADIKPVMEKVLEEFKELEEAITQDGREAEMGDLFFALVNLARWLKIDAESALRGTNQRFRSRFSYIEQESARTGKSLSSMTLQEMDALWEQAKARIG